MEAGREHAFRKVWLRNPALWLLVHLVSTRASVPSRMLPALNPFPKRPMALQKTEEKAFCWPHQHPYDVCSMHIPSTGQRSGDKRQHTTHAWDIR